jgi:ubiquitin carboxyl-terminal hydrolase 10
LIESLPPILVLHLKRFLYDTQVGDVVKVGKPISFTPELEIDPSMFQWSGYSALYPLILVSIGLVSVGHRQSQKIKYKLFGGELLGLRLK